MKYADFRTICAWEPTPLAPLGDGELVAVTVSLPIPGHVMSLLDIAEYDLLVGMKAADTRRQATFIADRLALRMALKRAKVPPAALSSPILRLTDGAPALPLGTAGSISHKRDRAVAVALPRGDVRLGVDLELVEPVTPAFVDRVLTTGELANVRDLGPEGFATAVTEVFALKEAAYKALPGAVQLGLDFDDLRVDGEPFSPVRHVRLASAPSAAPYLVEAYVRHEGRWVLVVAQHAPS